MKSLKKNIFALFILISFNFSIVGCNSSDDDSDKELPQKFLEKYDGTIWREVDDLNEVYYYFQNDLTNPVIKYYYFMNTCYISTGYEKPYFSIKENSEGTLEISEIYSDNENYTTIFSSSAGNMTRYKVEFLNGSKTTWNDELLSSQKKLESFTPICD